jgi:hypothetical protein
VLVLASRHSLDPQPDQLPFEQSGLEPAGLLAEALDLLTGGLGLGRIDSNGPDAGTETGRSSISQGTEEPAASQFALPFPGNGNARGQRIILSTPRGAALRPTGDVRAVAVTAESASQLRRGVDLVRKASVSLHKP